jgi:hypothetical protein
MGLRSATVELHMTDLSILPRLNAEAANSSSEVIAAALGRLGEVFTQWHELARTVPSLRHVAHDLLRQMLPESGGLGNPEALFINSGKADGLLATSISLTDALLQALTQGLAEFDPSHVQVYSRHDSTHEQHLVPNMDGVFVLEVLDEALNVFPGYYKDRLDAFWSEILPTAGDTGESQTRHRACTTLHREILTREMDLLALARLINEADKNTLVESFKGSNLYRISLTSETGSCVLTSAFVIPRTAQTRSPLTLANCEGNVFLLTAADGIELYDSLSDLDQKLRARLSDVDARDYLLQDVPLKDRTALLIDQGVVIGPVYSDLTNDLMQYRMQALRRKQVEDFDFFLATAQQARQPASDFLPAANALSQLNYLDIAQKRHFQQMFSQLSQQAMPRWFKDASAGDQALYRTLAAQHQKHVEHAARLMAGLESLRTYALDKINAYILNHLGYQVDPEQMFISICDQVVLGATITESFTYRQSLLDFVTDGLPVALEEMIFTLDVPERYESPGLDFPFIEKMIAELDVRQHFELDTERRFYTEETLRAIAHQRDSAIALSAWAAHLQKHLLDDKSQELIQLVRGDQQEPGTEISMGGLAIMGSRHVMKDVLIFRMRREGETHYVLYAPGAPGDRDLFEFSNWQRLSIEVGGWLAKAGGPQYVIDQMPAKSRADVTSLIRRVLLKPTEWSQATALFVAMAPQSYENNLIIKVRTRVAQDLSEAFAENVDQDLSLTYSERRVLALLDARISALNERFNRDVALPSYRDFVREKGGRWITEYLKNRGINLPVDPDTVWFNLNSGRDERNPFSAPPLEDISLTALLMNDFLHPEAFNSPALDEYLNSTMSHFVPVWALGNAAYNSLKQWYLNTPKPAIYSTVGQDLSGLTASGIRELLALPLGEDYISILQNRLNDPDQGRIVYRRAVLAKRKYFEIYRDALRQYLKGALSKQQYEWLIPLLSSVDSSTQTTAPQDSAIYELVFDNSTNPLLGKDGRVIEGALIFTRLDYEDSEFRLIYTPGAPDGIHFRTHEQIISTMKYPGLPAYYYSRASYKDQRVVGTMVQNLEQDPDTHQASFSTRVTPIHRITDLEQLYEVMIQRMIEDVDTQTESAAERNAATAYTVVKWTGTILLLPFPTAALAWGLVDTAVSFAQGYSAYRDGDRNTALEFFILGYIGLLSAGGTTGDIVSRSTGKAWRLIRWASSNRLPIPVV